MARTVIVTGAAGGLGSAVAARFAEQGENLVLTDIADRVRDVESELARIHPLGPNAVMSLVADATDAQAAAAVVAEAVQRWGRLDVLVNPAGGSLAQLTRRPDPVLWELTEDDWQRVLAVNLTGSFHWVRAAAQPMIAQSDGAIVLVASGTGLRPGPRMAAYAAAKAGVIGLMKAAARDLGTHNIRVNAVNPGLIPHDKLPEAAWGANIDRYRADTMLGRLSDAEDFARFVANLVDFTAISGQIYNLDSRVLV